MKAAWVEISLRPDSIDAL